MPKPKVVELLLARRLAADYKEAAALIRRGLVWVDGQRLDKPGTPVGPQVSILVKRSSHDYASRGGLKLESALDALGVVVKDRVCLDLGASTGGFTDCLLRRGARRVYAFDVGKGLLDWRLRQDPRVRVREGVNVRYLTPVMVEAPQLVTIDVSFISLRQVLPALRAFGALEVVALCKPQFEAGRRQVPPGGVIRDPSLRQRVLDRFRADCDALGFRRMGEVASCLPGRKGNIEHFFHFRWEGAASASATNSQGGSTEGAS